MKSTRNKTLICSEEEISKLEGLLITPSNFDNKTILDKIINGDFFESIKLIKDNSINLLIMDPPYNLTKDYNGEKFKKTSDDEYSLWFQKVINEIKPKLTKNATVYVCSDWKTSCLIEPILSENFLIQNRITWEREKGRGCQNNWKNNTEDIWFCTNTNDYYFNVNAVKLKKQVIAPYKDKDGKAKDWTETNGQAFRLTYPSNILTDITIPFWSMPENTKHPTQKPEKLIAKLILASSKEGELILDPFLGSGTTAVVCKKLNRKFIGIEVNKEYACLGLKRLEIAETDNAIQGYEGGVFWERNSKNNTKKRVKKTQQEKLL